MKQVILTTVEVDELGKGKNLMMSVFARLCFTKGAHGEVEDGGGRCIVDCCAETAFKEANDIQKLSEDLFDIRKILIREVEI